MRSHFDAAALRERIGRDEFDYTALTDALRGYANVRDRISRLLRDGSIIRVKKGLYVFAERYRRTPVSRELLANLVYGPSYVSMEYALQYYGVIPERVEMVTSVTPGQARSFTTPVGDFSYRYVPRNAFPLGMDRVELPDGRAFLIATPEKAVADKVVLDRVEIRRLAPMREYLFENLRIDRSQFVSLRLDRLMEIARAWPSERMKLLVSVAAALSSSKDGRQ